LQKHNKLAQALQKDIPFFLMLNDGLPSSIESVAGTLWEREMEGVVDIRVSWSHCPVNRNSPCAVDIGWDCDAEAKDQRSDEREETEKN